MNLLNKVTENGEGTPIKVIQAAASLENDPTRFVYVWGNWGSGGASIKIKASPIEPPYKWFYVSDASWTQDTLGAIQIRAAYVVAEVANADGNTELNCVIL